MVELDTTYAPDSEAQIKFSVSDVTGSRTLPVEVPRTLPAEAVAQSVASLMALPANVPWALREEVSSAYLDADVAIGDQIAPGAEVTVTPKTHLA